MLYKKAGFRQGALADIKNEIGRFFRGIRAGNQAKI